MAPKHTAKPRWRPVPGGGGHRFEGGRAVLLCSRRAGALGTGERPHRRAAASAAGKLDTGGILLATIRDYDSLVTARPAFQGPAFYDDGGRRRIVHQVWDWTGDRHYTMHLYITRETATGWKSRHFSSAFHAVPRAMLTGALEAAGFSTVRWIEPGESGYYQPIVLARHCRY